MPGTRSSASARGKRFLIDGSMARGGGGYTYLVNIVPLLSRLVPDARFRVLVRTERLAEALSGLPNVEVDRLPEVGLLARFRFLNAEVPRLAAEWGADLYFSVGEYSPLRMPCPVIAAFRNPNVFTRMEQGWPAYQRLRLKALRLIARLSTRNADRILFVSEDSARWIGDIMDLPEWKRTVVHHGIDTTGWRDHEVGEESVDGDADEKADAKSGVILSVSSIYRYKNFVRLIEAYARLATTRSDVPDLVIVGDDQDPDYHRKMIEAREATGPLAEQIHIVGAVPYEQIREYYRNASLFVFPSYLETFGHPLLEAMGCDVPVVASDLPVFREIAADAVLYADPFKVDALAAAMDDALTSDLHRRRMIERGRERVARFGWDRSANRLLAMFDDLLEEASSREGAVSRGLRPLAAAALLSLTGGSSSSARR